MTFKLLRNILLTTMLAVVSLNSHAATGFFKGETTNGMNKICYYDVLGSIYTLNVRITDICPVTYNF